MWRWNGDADPLIIYAKLLLESVHMFVSMP